VSFSHDNIIDFIYNEARMLDQGRFSDWLALWLPEGHYWMPLDYKQTDPINETSLLYEDNFMLRLRVERLNGQRTFSQKPKSRCHHVLQRPFIDEFDADTGNARTNTSMLYVETRLEEQQVLAITATHEIRQVDGELKIANKKVELLNSDAALNGIQLLP